MEKIKTDCELEILKPKFLTGRDHDIGLKNLFSDPTWLSSKQNFH